MKCRKTPIPADSLTRQFLPAGYTDAFLCEIPAGATFSPDDLMISFWTVMPGWVNALFKLRNVLVKPFGLKGGHGMEQTFAGIGDAIRQSGQIRFISVPAKNPDETVVKLTDEHLDAYLSVYLEKEAAASSATAITLVHFHNRLGRTYFFFIKPFHKIVVKSMLKNTIRRFLAASGG